MKYKYILEVDYWSSASAHHEKEWFVTSKPAEKIAILLEQMPPTDHSGFRCSVDGIKIHTACIMEADEE
jgi:hypothetical protein